MQQLAYRASDLDALSARLREQGVRLVYDTPRRGTARLADQLHPPQGRQAGVLIELVEPAADEH